MKNNRLSPKDALHKMTAIKDGLCVLPVGGCGEFGINMTIYYGGGEYYVVDCGLMFPDPMKLGVDAIIPDVSPIFAEIGPPKAYLITHGHEDHIGALPHLFKRWPAPIYCTAWTAELIKDKFSRAHLPEPDIYIVAAKDRLHLGAFKVDWVHVNHSIPMCCSLVIHYETYKVVHTGDFKFDDHSLYEPKLDAKDFSDLLPDGCDLLVADSTNAPSPGDCPSEVNCLESFEALFPKVEGNIYVTTFSSNLWRIKSILAAAKTAGRQVHFAGAGMEKTVSLARKLGLLPEKGHDLVSSSDVARGESKNRVIICTGCQGEPLAALARIVRDEYPNLRLREKDCVVFSSRMIPGSERQVYYMMSQCARKGIDVYSVRNEPKIHVSGHAYQGDLKRLVQSTQPRQLMAVHGTFSQLDDHTEFVNETFNGNVNVVMGEDGTVYHLNKEGYTALGQFDIDWLYIDAFVKTPITSANLKQRLKIGELGLVVFSGVFSAQENTWLGEVFLDMKGIELPAHIDPHNWYDSCKNKAERTIENAMYDGIKDPAGINEAVRIGLRQHFAMVFKKKIVVSASVHRL